MSETKPRTWIFNFQQQFAPKVESGEKLQTIRARRKDGKMPRGGDRIKLYTGLRTRRSRLLYESTIVECFPVVIEFDDQRPIVSNGVRLHHGEADAFARLDGFSHSTAMLEWFRNTHRGEFEGFCVRWRSAG